MFRGVVGAVDRTAGLNGPLFRRTFARCIGNASATDGPRFSGKLATRNSAVRFASPVLR